MATLIKTKNGKKVVLYNPAERSKRYSRELVKGVKRDGTPLTGTEAAFRMGVLNERKMQAKIYNKKHGLKGKSKKKKTSPMANDDFSNCIDRGRPQDDYGGGWY